MKCKQCISEGKKSTVYPGHGMVTKEGPVSYYDEDGHYHYHDSNTSTMIYKCSNGHSWKESKRTHPPCWCEIGARPDGYWGDGPGHGRDERLEGFNLG